MRTEHVGTFLQILLCKRSVREKSSRSGEENNGRKGKRVLIGARSKSEWHGVFSPFNIKFNQVFTHCSSAQYISPPPRMIVDQLEDNLDNQRRRVVVGEQQHRLITNDRAHAANCQNESTRLSAGEMDGTHTHKI